MHQGQKLTTRQRLLAWGYRGDLCVFCRSRVESLEHLYFECSFSNRIWKQVLRRCLFNRSIGSWNEEAGWAVKILKRKEFSEGDWEIYLAAVLYHIWLNQNARIHDSRSEAEIIHVICQDVKFRLALCKNVRNTIKNRVLCSLWRVPFSIFDKE